MAQCPFCGAPLNSPAHVGSASAPRCPACGRAVAPVDETRRSDPNAATWQVPITPIADEITPNSPAPPPPAAATDLQHARNVADIKQRLDAIARRGSEDDDEQRGYTVQWLGHQVLGANDAGQGESPFESVPDVNLADSGPAGGSEEGGVPAPTDGDSSSAAAAPLPGNPAKDPKNLTLPDRQLAATVDLTAGVIANDSADVADKSIGPADVRPAGKKQPTIPDRRFAATVDLANGGPASVDDGPGTINDRRLDVTLDSTPLDDSDAKRLQSLWKGTYAPKTSPRMTIKGQERVLAQDSRLVIINRSIRDVSEKTLPPAGAEYELLGLIGEGGMGVVYAARQASIDRTVALKMLKPDSSGDAEQRNKFLSEAVVTGDLDHPNIVPIYDLGANQQRALFYSMKRVQGTPWLDVINKKSQSENLEIFMKVADAIGFAHSRGVVHRDLKPENVMLGEFGEVLVMDWGLALSTPTFRKAASITQSTSMGGTPAYMAPEMATGPIDRVGPASDIYLLGAVLFEIITGVPPHTGKNVMNCLYAAARNEIRKTSYTGELMDIALKAMSTAQTARYATVKDFQDAIRQYRAHSESIALAARAEQDLSTAQKSGDYQVFSRAIFALEEALALWDGNQKARTRLVEAKLAYAESAFGKGDFDLANSLLDAANPMHSALHGQVAAAQTEREARQHRLRAVRKMVAGLAASIVVIILVALFWIGRERNAALKARDDAVEAGRRATNAEKAAKKDRDDALAAGRRATEAELTAKKDRDDALAAGRRATEAELTAKKDRDEALAAGRRATEAELAAKKDRDDALAAGRRATDAETAAKKDRDTAVEAEKQAKKDRDAAVEAEGQAQTAKKAQEYEAYVARIGLASAKIEENAFDSARALLAECQPEMRNWEWGRLAHLCRQDDGTIETATRIEAVASSIDGKKIAAAGEDGVICLWNAATRQPLGQFPYGAGTVNTLAFSPDGKSLAVGGTDRSGYVRLLSVADGRPVRPLQDPDGHTDAVTSVVFSHDGKRLLTASMDNSAKLWDVESGRLIRSFIGHTWWVWSANFSPDERSIVTASQDGTAVIWPIEHQSTASNKTLPTFTGHKGAVFWAEFSPDPKSPLVVSGGYDKRVLVWDPREVEPLDFNKLFSARTAPKFRALDGHTAAVRSTRFSADGHRIVSAGYDNTVRLWDVDENRLIRAFRGHGQWVRGAEFLPDQKHLLSGSYDKSVKLWNIEGYEESRVIQGYLLAGHDDAVLAAAFSRDGKRLITASRDRTAKLWDFASGQELATFREGHEYLASAAIFYPGGKSMITSAIDDTVRVWDVTAGTQRFRLQETGRNAAVALSPDGKWILTGGNQKPADDKNKNARRPWFLRLWNAETGDAVLALDDQPAEVTAVAFAPSSALFYVGDSVGRGWLRRVTDGAVVAKLDGQVGRISAAAFLPGGRRLLTASIDNTVAQWDVESGKEIGSAVLKHPDAVTSMYVSLDGRKALTSCADKSVRLWDVERSALLGTLDVPNETVNGVAISPDSQRAVTVGYTKSDSRTGMARSVVRVWDLLRQQSLGELNTRGSLVWSAIFSEDNASILTVGGNSARLWDLKTQRERMSFSPHSAVASASLSSDGTMVITGSWDNSAKIWNVANRLAERKLVGGHRGHINSVQFSPDNSQALTSSDDGTAKRWNVKTGEVVGQFVGHKGRVMSAVFSPDGQRVLTTSSDQTAQIWDSRTSMSLHTLEGHKLSVYCGVFAEDGRVVTGSDDNTARVWDGQTGEPIQTAAGEPLVLAGHTAGITSVAVSHDGRRILTGSRDNAVKLWDAATGKEILTLKGHQQEVTSVAFSYDGRYAVSASEDGAAIVWLTADWREN